MKRLLLSLLLLGGAASASATTRYVSTTGSDANSCAASATITTPKRNLTGTAGAIACMTAGDTLLVRAGNYLEELTTFPSGTSWSNKVRIANYPSETVWLRPGSTFGYVMRTVGSPAYVEIDGINMDGRSILYSPVYIDGDNGGTPNHIRLQNLEVWGKACTGDCGWGANIAASGTFHEFLYVTVHGTAAGYGYYLAGNDMLVDHGNIYDVDYAGGQCYSGSTGSARCIIRNTLIHDITIDTWFLGHLDTGNRLAGWMLAGPGNHQFYNNVIYNNNSPGNSGPAVSTYGGSNNQIYNNTIVNNPSLSGIDIPSNSSGNTVRNNLITGNMSNGVTGTGWVGSNNLQGVNALFVNAAGGNFHLQSGSPARNAGTAVSLVTVDLDGNTRPQECCYDVGAYEFLVSSQPVPVTVAITAPVASNASYETTTSPLTTLAGTASGGTLTSCTWTNTNGGSGSGTATGTSSWSVASITLTANAINHLTVTCSNTSPASSSAAIDVYYVAAAGSVTDNFNRANWPTLGPNWTSQTTGSSLTVANSQAATTAGSQINARFSGFAAPNDQCTQATIKGLAANNWVGVMVRAASADATLSNYSFLTDGTTTASHTLLSKVISGTVTHLGDIAVNFVTGDIMKLCVTGQSLQVYRNGIAVGSAVTVTTTTLSSGQAGILLQGTSAALDNFSGSSSADVTPPTISITAPSSSGTYTATETPLTTLAGTAADNIAVTSVTWVNSAGGSGTATGTTSWSVASISLTSGTNNITVTAHDAAGNTTPTVLSIDYIPATPVTPPDVTITSFSTNYETSSPALTNLAGSVFSSGGTISSCTWANTVGGSGSGSTTGTFGTATVAWAVSSITLTANSINRVIVTCTDNLAQTGSAQVDILYVPPVTNAADNFTRTNWPTLGPNWTTQGSYPMRVLSNAAHGQTASVDHYAAFTGWGLTANQCSQATITALASGKVGVLVRASGNNAYLLTTDGSSGSGHTYIAKVLSGTQTSLGALSTTFSNGNTMKLCVTDSSLQAYKNGTAVGGAVTDSALTSGSAGVYTYNTTAAVDSFVGSNVSGTTVNNKNPIADPGGPYTGTANTAVKVDASHSIAKRGVLKRYTWSWGDGTADTVATAPITTHTFTTAGVYTITLIVRDSRNKNSLPVSTTVTVS